MQSGPRSPQSPPSQGPGRPGSAPAGVRRPPSARLANARVQYDGQPGAKHGQHGHLSHRVGAGPPIHDSQPFTKVFNKMSRHSQIFDGEGEQNTGVITQDFSKQNENRCKYNRVETPLDRDGDRYTRQDPRDAQPEGPKTVDPACFRPPGVDGGAIDQMHLWATKQDLLDAIKTDLLELGKAVVTTLKQELQSTRDYLTEEIKKKKIEGVLSQELHLDLSSVHRHVHQNVERVLHELRGEQAHSSSIRDDIHTLLHELQSPTSAHASTVHEDISVVRSVLHELRSQGDKSLANSSALRDDILEELKTQRHRSSTIQDDVMIVKSVTNDLRSMNQSSSRHDDILEELRCQRDRSTTLQDDVLSVKNDIHDLRTMGESPSRHLTTIQEDISIVKGVVHDMRNMGESSSSKSVALREDILAASCELKNDIVSTCERLHDDISVLKHEMQARDQESIEASFASVHEQLNTMRDTVASTVQGSITDANFPVILAEIKTMNHDIASTVKASMTSIEHVVPSWKESIMNIVKAAVHEDGQARDLPLILQEVRDVRYCVEAVRVRTEPGGELDMSNFSGKSKELCEFLSELRGMRDCMETLRVRSDFGKLDKPAQSAKSADSSRVLLGETLEEFVDVKLREAPLGVKASAEALQKPHTGELGAADSQHLMHSFQEMRGEMRGDFQGMRGDFKDCAQMIRKAQDEERIAFILSPVLEEIRDIRDCMVKTSRQAPMAEGGGLHQIMETQESYHDIPAAIERLCEVTNKFEAFMDRSQPPVAAAREYY